MNLIDPTKFKQEDMPVFSFSDDMRSFAGWGIKAHSKGNYSHSMMMIRPGYFATQGATYKEVPVETYMKPYIRLKFWQYSNLPEGKKKEIIEAVQKDLSKPWWLRRYDAVGILGQLIPGRLTRKINIPYLRYCSERVRDSVIKIFPDFPYLHPTPSEINGFFITKKEMVILGYYLED